MSISSCLRRVLVFLAAPSFANLKFTVVVTACDCILPEGNIRMVLRVIVKKEEGGHGLALVGSPLMKTTRIFLALHVHLKKSFCVVCIRRCYTFHYLTPGWEKTWFFLIKPSPVFFLGFIWFYWAFLGFLVFYLFFYYKPCNF